GSYYTPDNLACFMARYIRNKCVDRKNHLDILEPSCGDGAFLKAISRHFLDKNICIDAIDLDTCAIEKIRKLSSTLHGEYTVTEAD
ncbi:hypothetical protein SB751_32705, partial [Cupriavidus sp. SIMBA_020]|uniref:hypothetical protein n=1 Tax=Cupriavidus sp. SIMBA_020 TaxID=3085766 RepID=UPI003978C9FE